MKKLLLALLFLPFSILGQCDIELFGFDTTTGDITIVINNSENCGCNEFTSIGTSCTLGDFNNGAIYHLNLGINFDNTLPMPECAEAVTYHPGWRFLNFTFEFNDDLPNDGAVTGDTLNFNIIPDNIGPFDDWTCWQEYLTTDLGPDECIEFVIWQINYSQTNTENQGAPSLGGYPWQDTCGTCAFQTHNYPDIDNSDNFFYWCGDELPPPPIYVYPGCTDIEALNYDPDATEDDGSCEYPSILGCTNPIACNYDVNATENFGCITCATPYEEGLACNEFQNSPNYWDWYLSVFNCNQGCTDPEAINYNEDAENDDGSCEYPQNECDVDIIDVDPINGIVTVEVVSSEGCSGGDVDMLMIGFHALDENCVPIDEAVSLYPCVMNPNSAHVGWWYGSAAQDSFIGNNYAEDWMPASSGDTLYLELYNPYDLDCENGTPPEVSGLSCCADDFINYWFDEGYSVEFVIWQINHGSTWYAADGGWATTGANGDGTQPGTGTPYVDQEDENRWVIGPCGEPFPEVIIDTIYIELPPDTIIITDTIYVELPCDTIYETDTLIITVTEVDTLYIELPPDTITITEIDTLYIELPPDTVTETIFITDTITVTETEFIFITDTIIETEYIYSVDTIYIIQSDTVTTYEFVEVDCETGLPCSEIRNEECNIYIPNAFTPDNDGYNDGWEIVLDPECWTDVKVQVISRWGNIVWESYDVNNLVWNGNFRGGDYYVQNEMYLWWFQARKVGTAEVKELRGHVTILR